MDGYITLDTYALKSRENFQHTAKDMEKERPRSERRDMEKERPRRERRARRSPTEKGAGKERHERERRTDSRDKSREARKESRDKSREARKHKENRENRDNRPKSGRMYLVKTNSNTQVMDTTKQTGTEQTSQEHQATARISSAKHQAQNSSAKHSNSADPNPGSGRLFSRDILSSKEQSVSSHESNSTKMALQSYRSSMPSESEGLSFSEEHFADRPGDALVDDVFGASEDEDYRTPLKEIVTFTPGTYVRCFRQFRHTSNLPDGALKMKNGQIFKIKKLINELKCEDEEGRLLAMAYGWTKPNPRVPRKQYGYFALDYVRKYVKPPTSKTDT